MASGEGDSSESECGDSGEGKLGFISGKSHKSLKVGAQISGSSIELSDPDDTFDPNEKLGFDLKFFRRFLQIQKIMFQSVTSLSTTLFVTLVIVSLLEEYVVYQVGLIPSKFYKVLGDKDLASFWRVVVASAGIIVGIALVKSGRQYLLKLLTVTWRQILCKALHDTYFREITYYRLNVLDKKIDNPDQRMTQDVDKFTATYCDLLPKTMVTPAVVAYYAYQGFVGTGWQGPVGCFVFFIAGTIVNKLIMSPIVDLVAQQEKCEGDFRFVHMQVKINSEAIAFHSASSLEGEKADDSLIRLAKAQHRLYFYQMFLNTTVNLYNYLGSIVSYLIIAVPIFSGAYDDASSSDISSMISKNSFVSMYLIFQFSQLVDLSIKVTDIAGVTHRISQLIERMLYLQDYWKGQFLHETFTPDPESIKKFQGIAEKRLKKDPDHGDDPGAGETGAGETGAGETGADVPAWVIDNVSFSPPFRQKLLVRDLQLTISAGKSLLVIGGSSTGKTSFLRVLRGLWPHSSGFIQRLYPPGPTGVFFIPQKLYLTSGTLREQFAFPCKPQVKYLGDVDQKIMKYMKLLNLRHILDRVGGLDVPVPWNLYESLSPGEVQRIYFIRLFLHLPLIAVLDEATSALPLSMEEIVYKECHRLGITLLSVGHRESLRQYHDAVLTLESSGSWKLENLN